MAENLSSQPPPSTAFLLSYPSPSILLVTINKPKQRNAISMAQHWEADAIFKWFDAEPSLLVAIITGAGDLAFCAGQDLKEQAYLDHRSNNKSSTTNNNNKDTASNPQPQPSSRLGLPPTGFAGLSTRTGRKPIIAAVNGAAMGGGFEICLNCDITLALPTATFALPEALRGLYAAAGGLARLTRTAGIHIASELALTGRRMSAAEALSHGLINRVVSPPSPSPPSPSTPSSSPSSARETLLNEAVEMARAITLASPDAVVVTRAGIREAWETASVVRAGQVTAERYGEALFRGENFGIGVRAFAEGGGRGRRPVWRPSRL
ncbi:ClpP/crotonase [Pseudovirgaria hyperparasitica]|uniref:ClpP/crotonase n=1 Tax=Pseudovirgaria hyperparasitica TaxID=470096 RepID=A0A6A6WLX0_9PEZI|nr:ClpP/crotonase [Pseudovirgaria hyperparasitica]KAF2763146.1 ClpP/crotonase [Pseudovirgaria hyperparasitica]